MAASPQRRVISGARAAKVKDQFPVNVTEKLCSYAHSDMHRHTNLDCGSASELSFSSSSETSVSRISGLDLFPYLRHRDRWTDGHY